MNSTLYQKLFDKLDSLSAIRKDLTLWCEIVTAECNDWCCWIEEWLIGDKYWECEKEITHYIWTRYDVHIIDVKWHPPVYTDCIHWIIIADHTDWRYYKDNTFELLSDWNLSKPFLSEQSDELGEYLLTLLK